MDVTAIHQNVMALVQRWSDDQAEILQRRQLNPIDPRAQSEARFKLDGVREKLGGVRCAQHRTVWDYNLQARNGF